MPVTSQDTRLCSGGRCFKLDILTHGKDGDDSGRSRLILQLSSLSEALSTGDVSAGFSAVLDFVETFLHVDAAHFLLREMGGERMAVVATSHASPEMSVVTPCLGEGLARAAMDTAELLCIEDLQSEPVDALGSLASAGFSSSLCAPIMMGENAVGALMALNREPKSFSIGDMELLWELSRVVSEGLLARGTGWVIVPVAPAVSATKEEHRQLGDLHFFNKLTSAIISASNLTELVESALDISMEAVEARIGSLMLFDQKSQCLTIETSRGLPKSSRKSLSRGIGEGVAGWVAQHQKSLLLHDMTEDPRFQTLHPRKEIVSALSIPLRTRDRLIGVLNLARTKGQHPFHEKQGELLETVANQLAIAIERMRLHQEMKRRSLQLTTLMEVGKTITSMLDLGVVSEQVAVQARNLARAQEAFLFYYDPVNDRVRFAAQSGCDISRLDKCVQLASQIALSAARYNRQTRCDEIRTDKIRRLANELKAKNWRAVPFRHRGHRISVVVLSPKPDQEDDPDTGELLEQFGSLAAVAIQNARTYYRQRAVASVMQESIMLPSIVDVEGLEIGHRLIPEHEVGGDYYDFIPLGEGKIGIVMADVSGSSVRSAAYSLLGRHALRAYARQYECPAEVLSRLNNLICLESDAEIFISVFYGLIDVYNQRLTYAIGGHEPPLIMRIGSSRIDQLHADGLLVGVSADAGFQHRTRAFNPGDMLVLYTDGLTEAPVRGRRFGMQRLKFLIKQHSQKPVQEIVDNIVSSRMRFSQNRMLDDMSVVIIRSVPPIDSGI